MHHNMRTFEYAEISEFCRQAENDWFKQQELYSSISIYAQTDQDEISDLWFQGSITVYGPKKEWTGVMSETNKPEYKIVPGYVNASSWSAGDHNSMKRDASSTHQEMLHRMKMMELALIQLNKRNELCLEWEDLENPFHLALYYKAELSKYQERERTQIKEQAEKKSRRNR